MSTLMSGCHARCAPGLDIWVSEISTSPLGLCIWYHRCWVLRLQTKCTLPIESASVATILSFAEPPLTI